MDLFIVTGASRGLGRAMTEQLLRTDRVMLAISRRPDHAFSAAADRIGMRLHQWANDIGNDLSVSARLEAWLAKFEDEQFATATLVNNAALGGRIGPVDAIDALALAAVVRVGLDAPMQLTAAFLRATRPWPTQRRVLNISSGAGRRPVAGMAAYCAVKAGLDMFSRTVAEDEKLLPNPARIVSLAPGVIDTDMQAATRTADPAGFPEQAVFLEMKAKGLLATPAEAARRCLAYLERPDYGTQPVADVRDA
jgi:benzil reductase ((S)-benzoin forming)